MYLSFLESGGFLLIITRLKNTLPELVILLNGNYTVKLHTQYIRPSQSSNTHSVIATNIYIYGPDGVSIVCCIDNILYMVHSVETYYNVLQCDRTS